LLALVDFSSAKLADTRRGVSEKLSVTLLIALTLMMLCIAIAPLSVSAQIVESWNVPCQKHFKRYKSAPGPKAFAVSNPNSGGGLGQACGASWNASSVAAAKKEALRQCNSARYGTCWVTQSSGGTGTKSRSVTATIDDKVIKLCAEGKPDEAIDSCTKLIVAGKFKNEGIAWLYYARGNAYSEKKNSKLAISDYKRSVSLNGKYGYAYFNLAAEYSKQENFEEAASNYRKASVLIEEKDKYRKEARERAEAIEIKIAGASEKLELPQPSSLDEDLTDDGKGNLAPSVDRSSRRIALVIGNKAYPQLGNLENPFSDANLIEQALIDAGFQVTKLLDANKDAMLNAMNEFSDQLTLGAEASFFYFSGHGVESNGENYLIPAYATLSKENQLPLRAIKLSEFLALFESTKSQINLVVLDACRNNNLPKSEKGIASGLAEVNNAPEGTLIAYATSPGKVAFDGVGNNSPYARALATAIKTRGIPVEETFKKTRKEVLRVTSKEQTPWDQSSIVGDFYFYPPH
jgi:tetratricopeptide (TPR) repeat protein